MAKDTHVVFILDKLNSGVIDAKDIISEFCSKFHKTERTFWTKWKSAKNEYDILLEERQIAKNNTIVSNDIENISNGLNSKSERLLNLQNQVNDINSMLLSGITPDTIIDSKTLTSVDIERRITYIERAQLMKVLKELQAEISKIEGDYAATTTKIEIQKEQPLFNV
jgi:hypothetical protein